MLAIVHIEIESRDSTTDLKRRLPSYYIHLRDEHGLPVLPIVVYLKVGLDGIGIDVCEERFWELEVLRFKYLYVGLPALDGLQYVEGENWLGVALSALMKVPRDRVAWLGAEALRRLTEAPLNDQQRFLLAECVEAYLPLEPDQQLDYERLLQGTSGSRVLAMNKTTYDKGWEKGLEKGREEGILEGVRLSVLDLGSLRFGSPPADTESRIKSIRDVSQLNDLNKRILTAQSWDELLNVN